MRIDAHVHMRGGSEADSSLLMERLEKAGFDGAIVFSESPRSIGGKTNTNQKRLERVIEYTSGQEYLYPFYFIDPTEEDALEQLETAKTAGVAGYKIICTHFYPGDERAMEVYRWIAAHDMPLMFHSGITYGGCNVVTGKYNRPCEFEPLLSIENLRFSIAHLSWPWVDECVALYGKFNAFSNRNPERAATLYLDITPGTPPTFREGALTHVFGNDFPVENIVFWGSDNMAEDYNSAYAEKIRKRDIEIFQKLGLPNRQQEKIFYDNMRAFLKI